MRMTTLALVLLQAAVVVVRGDERHHYMMRGSTKNNNNNNNNKNNYTNDEFWLQKNETWLEYINHRRKLQGGSSNSNEPLLFRELDCNRNLAITPCEVSWTSFFGRFSDFSQTVVIPCGRCIVMDYPRAEPLVLKRGLDIQGRLVFPNRYKVQIKTPFVRVQGELHMTSIKRIDGNPDIHFIITGTDETLTSFLPANSNAELCDGTVCSNMGKKPILVAGGRLVINALPPNTPTWVNLYDIVEKDESEDRRQLQINTDDDDATLVYTPPPTIEGCSVAGVYIEEDFKECFGSNFAGSRGSHFTFAENSLMVYNRRHSRHGIEVDLKDVQKCLQPGRAYIITARVRLTAVNEPDGSPSECSRTGTGCLEIISEWMNSRVRMDSRKVYTEQQSFDSRYGEWFDIATQYTFDHVELDSSNIFNTVLIYGPERDVVIEINEFTLRLPPPQAFPKTTCSDLIPGNGDAEQVGLSPFPFQVDSQLAKLSVAGEDGNHFFRVLSGQADNVGKLLWNVPRQCIEGGVRYRFNARIRIEASNLFDGELSLHVKVKRWYQDESSIAKMETLSVTSCGPSNGAWVDCESYFTFSNAFRDEYTFRVEMVMEPYGGNPVWFDVDDLSFIRAPEVGSPADGGSSATEGESASGRNGNLGDFSGGNSSPSSGIVVPATVQQGWAPGAEVLITSHTLDYKDSQTRVIRSIRPYTEAGYVVLELDAPIIPATTTKMNAAFAVEVALLSRNILFEGADDDDANPLHGAHLMVFRTETPQVIKGVELRNFGQQGNLGRYPLHFHLCEDHAESVVVGNLIRNSNQRCIVVHGTNELSIEGNIAYKTKGHCFMTEDGYEQGNVFKDNLGAWTERPQMIIPNLGSNGDETDFGCSTFWITNPSNRFINNVAAGSQVNGFWFELNWTIRGPNKDLYKDLVPKTLPLTEFRNNVAHSNARHGFRTYPDGFIPEQEAIFYNTRSFRNRGDGIFFHNSRNLVLDGGVYADNLIQVDFDRADEVALKSAVVIGVSPEFRSLRQNQNIRDICSDRRSIAGVHLHTFVRHTIYKGATIEDTSFSGFHDTGCGTEAVFDFDDDIFRGSFDYFTTISGVSIERNDLPMSMCEASRSSGVNDIYITDLDSSLRPSSSSFTGTSTIVSNMPVMTTFIKEKCTSVERGCYAYCEDTCLRTVTFGVSLTGTENYKLQLCESSQTSSCIVVDGKFYNQTKKTELESILENSAWNDRRYFAVSVPRGSYEGVFIDDGGSEVWPDFVEETYEDVLCADALEEGSISIKVPDVSPSECNNLIRNGDAQDSSTEHLYWLHRSSGVRVVEGAGIGGSNAFGDYIQSNRRTDAIVQFLDTRCIQLRAGQEYEIKAWVKLVDPDTGVPYVKCDPSSESCPFVGIKADNWVREPVASMVFSYGDRAFQLVHGLLTIGPEMTQARTVMFYVERSRVDFSMLIDNVSMELVPQRTPATCGSEIVYNGDFQTGDSRSWLSYQEDSMTMVATSTQDGLNYALKTLNGGPKQNMRTGCLISGHRYSVRARFRLQTPEGAPFACEPSSTSAPTRCPRMRVRGIAGSQEQTRGLANAVGIPGQGWMELFGIWEADDFFAGADNLRLTFDDVKSGLQLSIDDVSISELEKDCSELIINGDMHLGFAQFWENSGQGAFSVVDGHNSLRAIRYSGRTDTSNGPKYEARHFLDYSCLVRGSTWLVTAQIKLMERDTTAGASCDLESSSPSTACPSIVIRLYESNNLSQPFLNERLRGYESSSWNRDGFNKFSASLTLPDDYSSIGLVQIIVRDFNQNLDLVLDDFSIAQAA